MLKIEVIKFEAQDIVTASYNDALANCKCNSACYMQWADAEHTHINITHVSCECTYNDHVFYERPREYGAP